MKYIEVFEAELKKHNIKWCKGDCELRRNHKRGFVMNNDKFTVHLDRAIASSSTLHRGLHEIGHCINKETGLRRYEKEQNAESFATKTMQNYGIEVPLKVIEFGNNYVARKKRHGDNIKEAKRHNNKLQI